MKRLVLVDGKSVFYRGYYAMGALSLSDGTPTGGVYGFAAIAMEIVRRLDPTKVVVAWDSKTSTAKRKAIFPDYKAGRVKPGDDFYAQIPLLKQLVGDLGWSFIEVDEYEADDIIGTLSRQADETGDYETYIISSDQDMLQIVDENTHMWRILKGFTNIEKIDVQEIEAKYGIKKDQFLDLKALKGDASDNIPGVPGIGEKTAAKLLNTYGSLEGIYAHLDQISGSVKAKLQAGEKSALMSKKLAQIMFDAPVSLAEIPDFQFNRERTITGLEKLEFSSLIRKLTVAGEQTALQSKTPSKPQAVKPAEPQEPPNSPSSFTAVAPVPEFAATAVPTPTSTPEIISWDVKASMHQDAKIAQKILSGADFWDLSQAAFLINPLKKPDQMLVVPEEEYARQLQDLSHTPRLYAVLRDFDLPLIPVLYKMERHGMMIDKAYFRSLQAEYSTEVKRLESEIFALIGKEINLNSPIQLSDVLFIDLRLPTKGIKKTSRGYSTGAKELEKLAPAHPVIAKIIEYREISKLLSTYVVPIPEMSDENNRIHTNFTQDVTATGRLSSTNPNLQNIPVRTEEGKRIRTGFIAPAGRKLVSADYSQFELRLAAILSGDKALVEDFNRGEDIHTKTAAEAFHVPIQKVTKAQRRAAKVVNFGILYGMSVKGLADAAHMSVPEAKAFIDDYFRLRAPIKQKLEAILTQARDQGFVETYFGRRRPTPDVKSPNFLIRQAAERAAANMPIQGTEADLVKRAMIRVDKVLPSGANLIMQVHDSLIVECDDQDTDAVAAILKTEMENVAPELAIKLAVDVTIGQNWGEL